MGNSKYRASAPMTWPCWTSLGLGLSVLALTLAGTQVNAILPGITPPPAGRVSGSFSLLAQQQQPRTALVIGNADYGGEDSLESPTNDALAMYEKLQELGFDVPSPLLNATKQEMEQALRDFAQRMDEGGINVFYYSGHADHEHGNSFPFLFLVSPGVLNTNR